MMIEHTISDAAIGRAEYAIAEIDTEIAALIKEVVDLNSRSDIDGGLRDHLLIGYREHFMHLLQRLRAVETKLRAGDDAPHLCQVD